MRLIGQLFTQIMLISKLEFIFCAFLAENNFVNALILFIRDRFLLGDSYISTIQITYSS